MIAHMNFGFKNTRPSITDWLFKWVDALKKQIYPNGCLKGRIPWSKKTPKKKLFPSNYKPITCLPLMWKILATHIREEIIYLLVGLRLFPEEQKGCHKGTRETGDLLYIDQHIFEESNDRRKKYNYGLDWLQRGQRFPQSWIVDCLKMYKISDKDINFITEAMKKWNDCLAKNFRCGETPESHYPVRCNFTIKCNSDDATWSYP